MLYSVRKTWGMILTMKRIASLFSSAQRNSSVRLTQDLILNSAKDLNSLYFFFILSVVFFWSRLITTTYGFREQDPSFATKAIHAAQEPEQWPDGKPVVLPISLSTTFQQDAPGRFVVYTKYHSKRAYKIYLTKKQTTTNCYTCELELRVQQVR